MMRQRYESAGDRNIENMIFDFLDQEKGFQLHKMPISYRLDAIAFRASECRGFAEIKRRNNESTKYPTYMISLGKVMAARQLTTETGLRSRLFVLFTDHLTAIDFAAEFTVGIGGRTDRGDSADIEPCAFFDMDQFDIIEGFYEWHSKTVSGQHREA